MKRQTLESMVCILILFHCFCVAAADNPAAIAPIKLEQIISREDPKFNCARASLTIGRDGMVYLTSAGQDSGYILRVSRDGKDKLGGASVPAEFILYVESQINEAGVTLECPHSRTITGGRWTRISAKIRSSYRFRRPNATVATMVATSSPWCR
ncbi:MAG: hypothetical protein HQ581_06950 [Planctomycetes bacterium]|nr:hypothetical protein [Planctomycetota bacterium]